MAPTKMALGQREKTSFEKKLVGIVSVITSERKAKFTLIEEGKKFANGTNSITVLLEDLPERPVLATNDKTGTRQYRIRMNSEGTEVEALTPVNGVFDGELIDLGPRPEKDADPMPREKVFDEGGPKENRHWEFFAVYKISSGAFKGVQCPAYNLHYKFEEDDANPGFTRFAGNFENKKAIRLFQLRDWGHIHNMWNDPIEWDSDTILPELLERGLESPKIRLIFKNGYISEVLPRDDEPEFLEDAAPKKGKVNEPLEIEDELDDADAVDEMLDGKKEEPVAKKSKAVPASRPATKRASKKTVEEDDDL